MDFEEKDVQVDSGARKELMQRGIMAVPVIAIGEEFIVGFDRARIDQALQQ